eukprot:1792913-Pyramimonas_sp.AAC.1
MRAVPELSWRSSSRFLEHRTSEARGVGDAIGMAATYVNTQTDNCWGNSHGYGPREASQASLQGCSLLGGRHVACGH